MLVGPLARLLEVGAQSSAVPDGLLYLVAALIGVLALVALLRKVLRVALVLALAAVVVALTDAGVVDLR